MASPAQIAREKVQHLLQNPDPWDERMLTDAEVACTYAVMNGNEQEVASAGLNLMLVQEVRRLNARLATYGEASA